MTAAAIQDKIGTYAGTGLSLSNNQFNIDSSVVTLTGSQTLTGKTLSGGTLTGSLTAGGGTGTSGQVLKSTGTGVEWDDVSGGGGISFSGSTANGLVTYGSSSSGVVESNLTFNGSTNLLTVNGTMNTGTITISNTSTTGELDIQGGKIYLRGENTTPNHGGILYLFDKDNTNFIAFTGGTGISSNYTITLPSFLQVVITRYYYQILLVICLGQIKVLVEEVVYHFQEAPQMDWWII